MAERTVLKGTIEIVRKELGSLLDDIVVERVVSGAFFTGVKLSSGHAGACSSSGHEASASLRGCAAAYLLDAAAEAAGTERVLGIATLNALAQMVAERRVHAGCEEVEGLDAFAAAGIQPNETVVVVGAFASFMRELRRIGAKHIVLERDPTLFKPHEMPYFREARLAPSVVPHADVLFITGATLANETFAGLIALARPNARIVLVGPTVTIIPDAFFECGVDIVAGVKVIDPDAFMNVIAQDGAGQQFFGASAAKVVLRKRLRLARAEAWLQTRSRGYPVGAS